MKRRNTFNSLSSMSVFNNTSKAYHTKGPSQRRRIALTNNLLHWYNIMKKPYDL